MRDPSTKLRIGATHAAVALVLAAAGADASWAQPAPPPRRLTVGEVMRLAERTSESVLIARAGVARARGVRLQARSGYFPQIAGSASYDRTLKSEFEGLFDAAPAMGMAMTPFADLPFGRRNIYRFGLSATQPLYTGGATTARNVAAAAGLRSAEIDLGSARAQAVLDAALAFYDAALADRLLAIAETTFELAERALAETKVGQEVGTRSEFDLLRAEVAVENERPIVLRRRVERDLAFVRLRQQLDLPPTESFVLDVELTGDELPNVEATAREVARVPAAEAPRAPVLRANEAVRANEAAVRLARAQRWPALSVGSQYGRVAYPDDLFPSWGDFRTNWTVGLALQLPIFTGGRITGDIAVAQADLSLARARWQQVSEGAQLETRAYRLTLDAARATWTATAALVQQARRAYDIAQLRYKEGLSTQLELTDARLALEEAQVTRAQAARELQASRLRVALLPLLPLAQPTIETATPVAPSPTPAVRAETTAAGATFTAPTQPASQR